MSDSKSCGAAESINKRGVKMKKNKFMSLTVALIPFLFIHSTVMPVFADVGEYQEVDTSKEETSAECQVIYKSTYDFSEEIPKYPLLNVTAYGYEGIYDGKPHGITVDCKTEGATILYSTDGKTYSAKKPEYTDAGTYVTYYRVEKDGYTTTTGYAVVTIKEAVIDYDIDDSPVYYDGGKHSIKITVRTEGCQILYSTDGVNYSSKKPEYKEPGTYNVYYKIMKDNYATVTGSSTVTIKVKDGAVNNSNQNSSNQNSNNKNSNKNNVNQNSNQSNSGTEGMNNLNLTTIRENQIPLSETVKVSNVQTGDESNIFFYAVMLAASISGLTAIKGRKEKRKL